MSTTTIIGYVILSAAKDLIVQRMIRMSSDEILSAAKDDMIGRDWESS